VLEEVLEMKEKELRKLREEQEVSRRHYEKGLGEVRVGGQVTDRNRLATSRNAGGNNPSSSRD